MILLSPSKTFSAKAISTQYSVPYPELSEKISAALKQKTVLELQEIFSTSEKISQQTFEYYQQFPSNSYTVGSLYAGEAFKTLDYLSFNDTEKEYADNNLRIFSALYGLLKPSDSIAKYRLDFKTNTQSLISSSLYSLWRPILNETFKDQFIINLSSSEFSSLLDQSFNGITIDFRVIKNGEIKFSSVFAKQMRGAMARRLIQEQTYDLEVIKRWKVNGYRYNPNLSSESLIIFTLEI